MPRAETTVPSYFEPLRQLDLEKETKEMSPSASEVWKAGLEQENEVVGLVNRLATPRPKFNPEFDLFARAEKEKVDPRDYITAMSDEEFDQIKMKRQRELRNKEILDAAGGWGIAAQVGAAVLSPTSLIPLWRGVTGTRSILAGGASVLTGAAIQEGVLYGTQETRTKGEVAFSLAASTIIGGIFGAIGHTLSKSTVDKIAHDMANSLQELTILPPPKGSTAGAAENNIIEDVGPMKKGWGADKLAFLSPITRGFQQWNAPAYLAAEGGSAQLRKMTAGFSQAGLALQDNIKFRAAVAGGNVEDLKRTYAATSYGARVDVDKAYIEYILGTQARGPFKRSRALVQGYRADGKLNYDEFKRQITIDIWSNFTREGVDPYVRKAAKAVDAKVYKPLYEEGVAAKIFTGEEKTVGDENYANRVYNNEVIMRRHEEFVSILAKNYSGQLKEQFSKSYEKLREGMARDKIAIEDAERPLNDVLALREALKAEAQKLEMTTSLDTLEGIDAIKGLRTEVRNLTKELEELKKTQPKGGDVEGYRKRQDRMDEIEAQIKAKAMQADSAKKALGEGLESYTKELAGIRRRLAGLSRSHALQDVRLQKKLEKIEKNEDAQVATILRAQKQLEKFVKMLDSVTDDKLDGELTKYRNKFAEEGKKFDKLEQDRLKLEKEFGADPVDPPPPKGTDEGGDGGPAPKDKDPEPPKPETPVLTKEQEVEVDDIVVSNLESAFDDFKSYGSIDDALRSHEQNIYDTIKERFPKDSPERALAEARAQQKFAEKFRAYKDRYDKLRAEDEFRRERPELFGVSMRDLDDAGMLKVEVDEVLKDPAKFKDFLELLKRGYKKFPDAGGYVFRQVREEDVNALYKKLSDYDYLTKTDEIFAKFQGMQPDEKLPDLFGPGTPPMTRKEAIARADAENTAIREEMGRMDRAYDKAMRSPDPVVSKVGDVVPPERPPLTGDPLTHRLNSEFANAIQYFRNVNQALEWFEKYGTSAERVIAQRIRPAAGNYSFYVVDEKSVDPATKGLRDRLRTNRGVFNRTLYRPANPGGAVEGMVLVNKNTADRVVVLHELLHAAAVSKADLGKMFPTEFPKLAKIYKELEDLRLHVKGMIQADEAIDGKMIPFYTQYATKNVHELIAVGLTDPDTMAYFKKIKYKGQTVYRHFVRILRELLGIPEGEHNALSEIISLTDRLLKSEEGNFPNKPRPFPRTGEPKGMIIAQEGLPGEREAAELGANFRNWFAGSQVVDGEGKPIVVYHGTSKDVDFKQFKVGKRGAWFTTERNLASDYSMQNDSMGYKMGPGWSVTETNKASRVMPVYLSIKKPYVMSPSDLDAYATSKIGYAKYQAELFDKLRAQGYDGVNFGGGNWVAFDAKQIKSAIGNNGDFSPKKPDINASPSPNGEDPAFRLEDRMDRIAARMDGLAKKIEDLDGFDRNAFRNEVKDMMRELADTHAKINAKRAVRNEKLWKQAENYSPEARAKRLEQMKMKAAGRPEKFRSRWNTQATGDLMAGVADFDEVADERAREVVKKILGVDRRLAYSDIIQQERGPELARLLNIPSEQIADFLETDIDHLVSIYTRTVGSDLAVAKVFGTADAAEEFKKLDDERQAMLQKIEGMTDSDGNPITADMKEDLAYKTNKFYENGRRDLLVLLERAKGIRGLPKDPDAWSSRAAKTVMDINYLRFMGGVVINSIADIARPVMRHGLTRTFKDGIIPMVRSFRTIRMSQREAKLAGTALDVVMHTRAMAMMDMFDDAYRGTKVEKGIHYLSTRMGTIALFDQWTAAMKEFTAGIVNARLMNSIAIVNGEKASAKEIQKAQEFLAKNNIDAELAQTIWREVTNGKGGGKVDGVWLPNTEFWNVADPNVKRARQAYRAALAQEVDSTVITPGFERPNWVDMNVPARMLAQFKSFGFSSTQKTLMAGLQEHDAAFLNGVMLSLGLGVVSYYLWANATGGKAKEKLDAALADLDGDGWKILADEAITRSGVLGVFADVQKFAHRVPVLRQYASLSGAESTRRAGGDMTESLLGPSFDLLERATQVLAGIDEPTKSTLHAARLMMPLQNIFYLRQLLDKVEAAIDLPERREAR
jgi:hypothetical protein